MEEPAMGTLTDKRRTYTFYVDDVVLDVFGPKIGAYGIAVYTLLARHAKQKQCFPSYRHIMKQLDMSRERLWKTITVLINEGLIQKVQRESAYGDLTSNLYVLLDLSQYHDHGEPSLETTEGSSPDELPSTPHELPSTLSELPSTPDELPLEGISSKVSHLREETYLPTVSYPGAGNVVSTPGLLNGHSPVAIAPAKTKKTKAVPISDEDWPGLRTLLTSFHLPLAQLDDNEWWNDLSYTCNSPSNDWLERQFAKMHAWLKENPHKQPTTRWKTFLRGWLERAYEYDRKTNGTKKAYTRT